MMDERVLCQQALMVLWQNLVSTGSFIEQLAIITGKVDFGWSKNISSRESSYHVQAEHKKESQKSLIRFYDYVDAPNESESFVAFIQWISRKIGDASPDKLENMLKNYNLEKNTNCSYYYFSCSTIH